MSVTIGMQPYMAPEIVIGSARWTAMSLGASPFLERPYRTLEPTVLPRPSGNTSTLSFRLCPWMSRSFPTIRPVFMSTSPRKDIFEWVTSAFPVISPVQPWITFAVSFMSMLDNYYAFTKFSLSFLSYAFGVPERISRGLASCRTCTDALAPDVTFLVLNVQSGRLIRVAEKYGGSRPDIVVSVEYGCS